jgi:hypothetical protein
MASIVVKNTDFEPLGFSSVIIYDSNGKKVGGLKTDKDGFANISDSLLSDKGGKIVVSYVGHDNATIQISQFGGIAFLKRKENTLGNVIIRPKPKPKPIQIKNPFEKGEVVNREPIKKAKSPIVPIALGGISLAALLLLLTTKIKVK